jgi:hypothetical protein
MNERDQIERDDESTSAAESCPKPAIDQPAEPPGSLLKVEGTELSSDASTEPSNNAPEPAILSAALRDFLDFATRWRSPRGSDGTRTRTLLGDRQGCSRHCYRLGPLRVFGTYWGGMVLVAGFAEVICKDEVWLWRLDLNRRTPLPARLVQMLQSPDEVHVAIKIGNEKSACRK